MKEEASKVEPREDNAIKARQQREFELSDMGGGVFVILIRRMPCMKSDSDGTADPTALPKAPAPLRFASVSPGKGP